MPLWLIPLCAAILLPSSTSLAAEHKVSFKRDVAPILLQHCQTCHGPEKTKGRYRIDTFQRLAKPGSSGDPALTPGKPDASQLFRLLITEDPDERMPKKADPLPKAQIDTIRHWIAQGAAFDGPDPAAAVSSYAEGAARDAAPNVYKRPVPITSLAFTPDGTELLASGFHELTRWNAKTGKLAGRIPLPVQRVQSIAVDPATGRIAVTGGTPGVSGQLLLLDLDGKSSPRTLEKTADLMLVARFSPNGALLAAGGADGAVRLYDVSSGKQRWRIEPHADWVTDLAFSPDGSLLVTASRDKSCRVFEVKTALADASYLDHPDGVYAVVFAADGKTVFSAGRDRRLHAWSASDGKGQSQTPDFKGDVLRLRRAGTSIFSVSADGKLREHAADKGVPQPPPATEPATKPADDKKKAEKPPPRLLLRELTASPEWVYAIAIDPKAGLLAAGSHDGKVRVWTLDEGKEVTEFVAAPGLSSTK